MQARRAAVVAGERLDQVRQILEALAQRRHAHAQGTQAEVEIAAEAALLAAAQQIVARGGDESHVDAHRAARAEPRQAAGLDEAGEPRLRGQRQRAHVLEDERAAVGAGERAGDGQVVGDAVVAEQEALDVRGRVVAVEDDERTLRALAVAHDLLGDEPLAGAGLAFDEDGAVGGGDARELLEEAAGRRRAADERAEAEVHVAMGAHARR